MTLKPPVGRELREVSLPDVSQMEASVRTQVLERAASVRSAIDSAGARPSELAFAYGELGKLLMAAEQVEAAESCYLNAAVLAPEDRRWPYYLGHLYRIRGPLPKSAAAFERALQLQPNDVATIVWLGEVYLAQGRAEEADSTFAKALTIEAGSVPAHFGAGRAALERKDYARAAKHLEQALAASPHATAAHYPLAMAYRGLRDLTKAEAHLRQRGDIQIHPADPLMRDLDELLQSPKAYDMRGGRALETGDFAGAADYFRKGLALEPGNASLRLRLGTALFQMGDAGGALEQFEQVVQTSPQYARGHYSLAVLLAASGRRQEAIDRFRAAVKYEPWYVQARVGLAGSLRESGRLGEALAEYEAARRMNPSSAGAALGYAMTLVRLERYQEARDILTEAMALNPADPVFPHSLARLLAAAPDSRIRDGRRALALVEGLLKSQQTLELGEALAMSLAELGQYEQAVTVQRDVIAAAGKAGLDHVARLMGDNLELYQRREPCRTPWRNGEMP
ncbi:MAG: tetratricopeptide repeat protein [Luteitalea sp.]|nr:tetratricopeptide repeat protein [Luteitalea sp.]